jgi:chemotaxis protein MotB
MKSTLDGEIPEYSLAPRGTKSSKLPWVLGVIGLAAGAAGGWMAVDEHNKANSDAAKLAELSSKLAGAEAKDKDLQAKLDSTETERASLAQSRDELSKNVQAKDDELAKLKGTYDELQDKLKGELKSGDVSLTQVGGKLRVDLVDKLLFTSGEAQISKRGENVLMRVGAILANIPDKLIQVSGHTDQTPIGEKRSAQFSSNWELSVARATNVVRFLQDKASVPGERLVASGYGEFHPVASNKSATGRARNRRIEILLTPSLDPKAIAMRKLKAEAVAGEPKSVVKRQK